LLFLFSKIKSFPFIISFLLSFVLPFGVLTWLSNNSAIKFPLTSIDSSDIIGFIIFFLFLFLLFDARENTLLHAICLFIKISLQLYHKFYPFLFFL